MKKEFTLEVLFEALSEDQISKCDYFSEERIIEVVHKIGLHFVIFNLEDVEHVMLTKDAKKKGIENILIFDHADGTGEVKIFGGKEFGLHKRVSIDEWEILKLSVFLRHDRLGMLQYLLGKVKRERSLWELINVNTEEAFTLEKLFNSLLDSKQEFEDVFFEEKIRELAEKEKLHFIVVTMDKFEYVILSEDSSMKKADELAPATIKNGFFLMGQGYTYSRHFSEEEWESFKLQVFPRADLLGILEYILKKMKS